MLKRPKWWESAGTEANGHGCGDAIKIIIEEHWAEQVNKFRYFGSLILDDGTYSGDEE